MNKIDFLQQQIVETRLFVNRLISELPENLWFKIPAGTDSNFAWQIGHLLISQNFHTLTVITGLNKQVYHLIPIPKYIQLFNGMGARHRSIEEGILSAIQLKAEFDMVHDICLENLSRLTDEVLIQPLEPIPFHHPVADTKYEALSWSFKHEMWHCAEMEEIKVQLQHPIQWLRE